MLLPFFLWLHHGHISFSKGCPQLFVIWSRLSTTIWRHTFIKNVSGIQILNANYIRFLKYRNHYEYSLAYVKCTQSDFGYCFLFLLKQFFLFAYDMYRLSIYVWHLSSRFYLFFSILSLSCRHCFDFFSLFSCMGAFSLFCFSHLFSLSQHRFFFSYTKGKYLFMLLHC